MDTIIETLKREIANSERMRRKLLSNIEEKHSSEIILNLVELIFDFKEEFVEVVYYVIDDQFPTQKISFEEFRKIVNNSC